MNTYPLSMWPEIYADWVNNFLTVAKFAEYYGISEQYANNIIEAGKLSDNFSQSFTWPDSDRCLMCNYYGNEHAPYCINGKAE